MKTFKITDAWLQLILLIVGISYDVYVISSGGHLFDSWFLAPYFIVGGIQVISCLLHLFFIDKTHKSGRRKEYHYVLVSIAAIACFREMISLTGILLISPLIAVMYCAMCFNELKLFRYEQK